MTAMVIQRWARMAAWVAAGMVSAGAVQAQPALEVKTEGEIIFATPPFEDDGKEKKRIDGAYDGVLRSSLRLEGLPAASINARAVAAHGALAASVDAHALLNALWHDQPPDKAVGGTVRAHAAFDEEVVLTGGPRGTSGTVEFSLDFSGHWGGGYSGPATAATAALSRWQVELMIWGLQGQGQFGRIYALGGFNDETEGFESASYHQIGTQLAVRDSYSTGPVLPTLRMSLPVIFGVPIGMGAYIDVYALAGVDLTQLDPKDPGYLHTHGADAYSDFSHTLRWGGIQRVLDASGREISGWTITSASGTDYSVAVTTVVPEPAAWLLLPAGLGVMALKRRRAR